MRVKPAQGLKVRDPNSKQPIPETGIEVSETDTFWARRLADGDVVLVTPTPAASPVVKIAPKGKE